MIYTVQGEGEIDACQNVLCAVLFKEYFFGFLDFLVTKICHHIHDFPVIATFSSTITKRAENFVSV